VLVDLGDDVTAQEDSTLTFNSAVSYTGTKGLTYTWTFGDGTGSSAQQPSHTYTQAGNYTVSLTVTDSDGISDSDSIYIEVLNVRPIANAGGAKTVYEGTTVTFDGSNSWDTASDLALLTYEWNFGDGQFTGASMENKVVTHTYSEAGVYVVRLVVRDDDWTSSNYAYVESQLVTVSGSSTGNGTVNFLYDLIGGSGGSSDNSSGGSSSGVEVCWEFGDGSYAVGSNVSHTYDSDGVYIATLIITDAFGAMSVHNIMVTVLNSPPTADAGVDVSGDEDESLLFIGGGSDPGGGPLTYSWDFGDGSTGTGQEAMHAYTMQGTYTVTLTVTDADGLTDTDTCKATVTNVVPIAGLTSNHTTEEGDIIGFYGTTSYDTVSDLPLLVYTWDFGDGNTGAGSSVTHAYADEGTYTVTLTVTDDDQAVDSATMTFFVDNAVPTASIDTISASANPILPGDDISISGSGTDKGTADVLSFSWSFGDGTSASGDSVTHSYGSAGTFAITLTVSDGDGGVATDTASITIDLPSSAVDDVQDTVDEADPSSFEKPKDQKKISDKLTDLIDNIDNGEIDKAFKDIEKLIKDIEKKVTDSDLQSDLIAELERIEEALQTIIDTSVAIAQSAQDEVDDASSDAFKKAGDQRSISKDFGNLIKKLEKGEFENAADELDDLEDDITAKVIDSTLQSSLLASLQSIRSVIGA
jgi:PKD repeat protein